MRRLMPLVCAAVIAGCGFQLRGARSLPFDTLYIALPETAEMRSMLKRNIEATTQARVVGEAAQAQAIFAVTADVSAKNILSLSSAGQVREFELVRTLDFRVHDAASRDLIAPGKITVRRDITFSDAQVLSKQAEEALLWRDIQNDLVQQLLRRLVAAKPKAGEG